MNGSWRNKTLFLDSLICCAFVAVLVVPPYHISNYAIICEALPLLVVCECTVSLRERQRQLIRATSILPELELPMKSELFGVSERVSAR